MNYLQGLPTATTVTYQIDYEEEKVGSLISFSVIPVINDTKCVNQKNIFLTETMDVCFLGDDD